MTHTDERFIDELRTQLPWIANGTLPPAERERATRMLDGAPALAAELQWLQSIRQYVQTRTPQWQPDQADRTLERVLALTRAETAGKVSSLTARPSAPAAGWSLRKVRVAMAVAASLFVAQAVVLWFTFEQRQTDELTPAGMAASIPASRAYQITFRGDATEAAIREALATARAEIVSGPGALGVYIIVVPPDDNGAAVSYLRTRRDVVEQIAAQKP